MDIRRAIEYHAIQVDALWACRFGMSVAEQPRALSSAVSLDTFNYLSLFRHESLKYLRKHHQALSGLLPQPTTDEMERSRNTIKLFDVHEQVDGVIDHFMNVILPAHTRYFASISTSPTTQATAHDLFITYYGDRVLYTTHSVAFTLGMSPDIVLTPGGSQYIREVAVDYGKHFRPLSNQAPPYGPSFVDQLDHSIISSEPVSAAVYYGSHFNGASTPGINALLCVFMASLNFLDSMVRLDDRPESRQTILKMQYITLYHVTSSLRKLRLRHAAELSQQSLGFIAQIVDDAVLAQISVDSARQLRNALMHYGLFSDVQASEIIPDVPCYGLIEKYLPGHDYASLSSIITEQVVRVAELLNQWA